MEKHRMLQAADFIKKHDDFLVLTHVQPDGDAYGSSLGMAHVLQQLGKKFLLVNEDPVADKFSFLPLTDQFQLTANVNRKFSHVISLDCGDRQRFGKSEDLIVDDAVILNLDHHKTNDHFGAVNLVDLDAAATSQIVYQVARSLNLDITKDLATCLYTGILTDTGGFRYSNTTTEVHQIAADLLTRGVEPYEIADRVLETLTWGQVQLIREALGTIERDQTGCIAWMIVRRELLQRLQLTDEDAEGLVSYVRNVQGVEVGILFREKEAGLVKVSLRSKYKIDVGEIALAFGGGGHARAAGCSLAGPIEQVQQAVVTKVGEVFSS